MSYISDYDESPISSPKKTYSPIPRSTLYQIKDLNEYSYSDDDDDQSTKNYRLPPSVPKEVESASLKYFKQPKSEPFQAFDETFEEVKRIDTPRAALEGVSIHLSNIAFLLPDKSNNRQYILSWEDISKINSVEATRNLTSFFMSKYHDIAEWTDKNSADVYFSSYPRQMGYSQGSTPGIRIFHYVGMGFPPPKEDKICIKENGFVPDNWISIEKIRNMLQTNILYIFDCDNAASLKGAVEKAKIPDRRLYRKQELSALFACGSDEHLHIPETLPQNIFTCIILDPITSLRRLWGEKIGVDDATLKMLINIFTESIAKDSLDAKTYDTYFQTIPIISGIWKNFILAQKLMKGFGITVHSIPELPDCSEHYLWSQFEYTVRYPKQQQFKGLVDLYMDQLSGPKYPTRLACSFITSLMKNKDMYENIIIAVAKCMMMSVKNCAYITSFINQNYISNHDIKQERSIEGKRAWNIIVSGILLTQPSSSKWIANVLDAPATVATIHSLSTDDILRKYLLSIIISLIDGQTYFTGFLGNETRVNDFCNVAFADGTSPETRLIYSALLRSTVSRSQLRPSEVGSKGIHKIAKILLSDNNALTRAIGVAILATIMYKNAVGYNNDILQLALPAAVDGSYRVRRVFAALVRCFAEYGGEFGKEPLLSVKSIISDEIEDASSVLGEIIGFLASDPCDIVHEEALTAQSSKPNSMNKASQNLITVCEALQHTAHCSLFSYGKSERKMVKRYPDEVVNEGGLELFEVLPAHENSGAVSSLAFDREHTSVAYGSVSGTLIWDDLHWRVCSSSVTDIAFIGGGCLAASSSSGSVYIMKCGFETPVDVFQPSLLRHGSNTKIALSNNSTDAFICTGSTDIVHWDLSSLRLIDSIDLPTIAQTCAVFDNEVVVALWDGRVISYDTRSLEVTSEMSLQHICRSTPISIGRHLDQKYVAFENGPCVFFDNGNIIRKTDPWNRASDFAIHPVYDSGIIIGGEAILVDMDCKKVATMSTSSRVTKCCFDGERPLSAIGNEDGTVAIWRIPKSL